MAHIDDVPADVTNAGQEHDYTGPTFATVVLVNAPVDAGGPAISHGPAAADAWIAAEVAAGRAWSNDRFQLFQPITTLALPLDYNEAVQYNYARATIDGRNWYLHITDLTARNPNRTDATVELDRASSYTGWGLGHSLIVQSHAAVAASQNDTYGDQFCQAPEPVAAPPTVGVLSANVMGSDMDDWTIIVISANDLRGHGTATPFFEHHVAEQDLAKAAETAYLAGVGPSDVAPDAVMPAGGGDHGLTENLFQVDYPWHDPGFAAHYVPSVKPSEPSTIDGIVQGGGVYLFTPVGWLNYLTVMQGASWVLEGVVAVRRVPSWAVPEGGTGPAGITGRPPTSPIDARWLAVAPIPQYVANLTTDGYDTTVLSGWRDTVLAEYDAQQYRKLVTAPYTSILVGTGDTVTTYEPDAMRTPGVNVHARTGLAHGENSIRVTVDYNDLTDQYGTTMAAGGQDGLLASGYSRAAANTGSAVLGPSNSALTSLVARTAMGYNRELAVGVEESKIPMNLGIIGAQTVLGAGAAGATAGFLGAGPAGAIVGGILGGGVSLATGALSANMSLDMLDISQPGSVDIAAYQLGATNLFNTISFRTWVQALNAVPGKGQAGIVASAWRLVTNQAFEVIVVGPRPDQAAQLVSRWRRFGYMIGRAFEPTRLDVMSRYSYWRTEGATIRGRMPQQDRQALAALFDRGVTVYESWNDIGRDVENTPITGFSY